MVGQVFMGEFFKHPNLHQHFEVLFFSTQPTSTPVVQKGGFPKNLNLLNDCYEQSYDLEKLKSMDIILTMQGGEYTERVFSSLMKEQFQGLWIDAASTLRLHPSALIVLDPINKSSILKNLNEGGRVFVGGNCTVSLMLLALQSLFQEDLIEWVSSMTYQAASGAGAKHMEELLQQMFFLGELYATEKKLNNEHFHILDTEEKLRFMAQSSAQFPKENFGHSLACNLLPYIDREMTTHDFSGQSLGQSLGQSKEEWKGQVEANKILNRQSSTSSSFVKIDGTNVRVGAMRSHSQGLTIKLKKNIEISTVEEMIKHQNSWVHFVPNHREDTLRELTPQFVSGTEKIAVGRVRKMTIGDDFLNVFTVGDQLLWGAATPLLRTLQIFLEHKS